ALVRGGPVMVLCTPCGSLQKYSRPAAERDAEKAGRAEARAAKSAGKKRNPFAGSSSPKVRAIWAERMEAHEGGSERLYTIREQFAAEEVVEHTKFGRGIVVKVISGTKMRVLFQDGERDLAMGR
ncbi:MAG: hypothetical protein VX938_05555, partial [Myxococcota bacterium]|nr:hypothetical protein [Myxococcota bacterium]